MTFSSTDRGATCAMARWVAVGTAIATLAGTALAGPAADEPERAVDPQDRIICKRFVETGSLVKGYRECKTHREWDRERLNIRTSTLMSGGCNSAESGRCLGNITVGSTTTPVPN